MLISVAFNVTHRDIEAVHPQILSRHHGFFQVLFQTRNARVRAMKYLAVYSEFLERLRPISAKNHFPESISSIDDDREGAARSPTISLCQRVPFPELAPDERSDPCDGGRIAL